MEASADAKPTPGERDADQRETARRRLAERLSTDVVGPIRAGLLAAAVVAMAGGLLGGLGGLVVGAAQPDEYQARATFSLVARSSEVPSLSQNRTILAEQNAHYLRNGRADELAAAAVDGAEFTGDWVPGPAYGELSYQVTAADPAVATKAARAVYDGAGFLGLNLTDDAERAPTLDLVRADPAKAVHASTAVLLAVGALLGAVAGLALSLLSAVPVGSRRAG